MVASVAPGLIQQVTGKLLKGDVITYNWVILVIFLAPLWTPWKVEQIMVIIPWLIGMCVANNLIMMVTKNGAHFFGTIVETKKAKYAAGNGGAMMGTKNPPTP